MVNNARRITYCSILGDLGANSCDEGKSKWARKNWQRKVIVSCFLFANFFQPVSTFPFSNYLALVAKKVGHVEKFQYLTVSCSYFCMNLLYYYLEWFQTKRSQIIQLSVHLRKKDGSLNKRWEQTFDPFFTGDVTWGQEHKSFSWTTLYI